jgi:ATP-binding cassette, subfamily C, bacterial
MSQNRTLGLISFFVRRHPRRTVAVVTLLILSGLAEGIGVAAMLPLLEISLGTLGSEQPSSLSAAVHRALASVGIAPQLGVMLGIIVLGMVLKALLYLAAMKQVGDTIAHVTAELRLELIDALMNSRWAYFVSQPAGRFANAMGGEASWAANAYRAAMSMMAVGVQTITYTCVAVLVSWEIAVAAMIGGTTVVLVLGRLVGVARAAGGSQNELLKALLSRLTDALQGIKPLKAMAREAHVRPLLEAETRGINRAQARLVLANEALKAAQEPIMVILLAMALFVVLTFGNAPFATVLMMAFLFQRLAGRISLLQIEYQTVAAGENAFWSFRNQIDSSVAQRESETGTLPPPALTQGVTLDRVSFGYLESLVLNEVSLHIPAGQFVALVGPSGAGKTTIADLIVGLHHPTSGTILLDGEPLEDIDTRAWRSMIGYVPQEMFLFHDTVLHNITLGDESIGIAEVESALRAAGAWDFVSLLPHGPDTVLGERGATLSGGQRQRIAIARALVRGPKLLILDEVTSSLDPITEASLCSTLRELSGQVTVLAISHQTALTRIADMVVRLEDGEIRTISSREPALSGLAATAQ